MKNTDKNKIQISIELIIHTYMTKKYHNTFFMNEINYDNKKMDGIRDNRTIEESHEIENISRKCLLQLLDDTANGKAKSTLKIKWSDKTLSFESFEDIICIILEALNQEIFPMFNLSTKVFSNVKNNWHDMEIDGSIIRVNSMYIFKPKAISTMLELLSKKFHATKFCWKKEFFSTTYVPTSVGESLFINAVYYALQDKNISIDVFDKSQYPFVESIIKELLTETSYLRFICRKSLQ